MELYIHIPFCIKKCNYCDFLSFPCESSRAGFTDYIEALCKELDFYKEIFAVKGLSTVFIGGGTPSVVDVENMELLLKKIDDIIPCKEKLDEYTIECNPGTLTKEKLELYKGHGINRLSIGLQSTIDSDLKILGRIHTFEAFKENYFLAREMGFNNINIDLISSIPGQHSAQWESVLRTAAELNPEHISAYSLIIEDGTPFAKMNFDNLPDEDEERLIYHETKRILKEYGLERYEISNYSRAGYESRHNMGYWTGEEYIGAGLGASSYYTDNDGEVHRSKNETDFSKYIEIFSAENTGDDILINLRAEDEVVGEDDLISEYAFLHLRLTDGICKLDFKERFGKDFDDVFKEVIDKYVRLKMLFDSGERIYLTEAGFDVSNVVMADFLL